MQLKITVTEDEYEIETYDLGWQNSFSFDFETKEIYVNSQSLHYVGVVDLKQLKKFISELILMYRQHHSITSFQVRLIQNFLMYVEGDFATEELSEQLKRLKGI